MVAYTDIGHTGTNKGQIFESLWNYMNKNKNPLIRDMYGKVSVQDAKEAISMVLEQSGMMAGSQSWDMDSRKNLCNFSLARACI